MVIDDRAFVLVNDEQRKKMRATRHLCPTEHERADIDPIQMSHSERVTTSSDNLNWLDDGGEDGKRGVSLISFTIWNFIFFLNKIYGSIGRIQAIYKF